MRVDFLFDFIACKEKSYCVLGVPVAATRHTCIDRATAVELGLRLVAAKNPLSFIEHLVPRERYCICPYHMFMFKVLHSCPSNTFLCGLIFLWHIIFLPCFSIFIHLCAKPGCFYPRSHCFLTLFPWFKEDCAWVRMVIYLYSTVYLSTIFWILLSLSEPLVKCMVLCCHTL